MGDGGAVDRVRISGTHHGPGQIWSVALQLRQRDLRLRYGNGFHPPGVSVRLTMMEVRVTNGETTNSDGSPGMTNPGDDAPPGTPGTGEDVCPECSGTGQGRGQECVNCGGTGKVIKGIAGG